MSNDGSVLKTNIEESYKSSQGDHDPVREFYCYHGEPMDAAKEEVSRCYDMQNKAEGEADQPGQDGS